MTMQVHKVMLNKPDAENQQNFYQEKKKESTAIKHELIITE